jgi:hypothetical protein
MLAHINPREAELLKAMGGAGTINPNTGLPEFYGNSNNFGQTGVFLQKEPTPLPTLAQVFGADEFKNIADKLDKTTVRSEGFGLSGTKPYEKIDSKYDKYVKRDQLGGKGAGGNIIGYSIPTDKKFQGKPLVAVYDDKGAFQHLTIEAKDALRPDPSRPNIVASPKFNKTGGITGTKPSFPATSITNCTNAN